MLQKRPEGKQKRPLFRRIIRVFLKVILGIFIFLILVIVLVQTPYVQNIIRGKAQTYLSGKLKTRVEIGNIYVGFPHAISLKNIYIEDQKKDTLFSGGDMEVDMDMWKLFHGAIDVEDIRLKDLTAKIKRALPDTIYNFQFIVDAFATKDSTKPEKPKDTSALQMNIRSVVLDNIRLVYFDVNSGTDAELNIGHSKIKLDKLDLSHQQFAVPLIELQNTTARYYQHRPLVDVVAAVTKAAGPPQPNPLQVQLSKIRIDSVRLDYRDEVGAMAANVDLGTFNSDIKSIDLQHQTVLLDKIELNRTFASISMGKKQKKIIAAKPETTVASAPGWRVLASSIGLDNNTIKFDDDNAPRLASGMDFSHLNMNLSFALKDLLYSSDSIAGTIAKGQMRDQSGFELNELHTRFLYAAHQAYLEDLLLKTPGTTLQKSARLTYPSIAAISKDLSKLDMDIDLSNSQIQLKDVLAFVPALRKQPAFKDPNAILHMNARVTGNMSALNIKTLQFAGFSQTAIDISGTVNNAMDQKHVKADLDIRNFATGRHDIEMLAPRGTIPTSIAIPASLKLTGKISGGLAALVADLKLNTSSGNVLLKGTVRNATDSKNADYNANVQLVALQLGQIMKNDSLYGPVSATFAAKGHGFDQRYANANFDGTISTIVLKKYNYHNLKLHGDIANKTAHATASIDDENIRLQLNATALMQNKFPAVKLDLQIDTLNMFALHLMTDTMQVKGRITADFASTNPDSLQGNAQITQLDLVNNNQHFNTDSIIFVAAHQNGIEDIRLHAEMADLDWQGKYKISEVATALQQAINKYYRVHEGADVKIASQDWKMNLTLRPSPLVLALMPAIKGTDSVHASVAFNSDNHDLHVAVIAPKIKYAGSLVQHTTLDLSTATDQLNYRLQTDGVISSGFQLYQTAVYGHIADNHIFTSLLLKDENNKSKYQVSGKLDKLKDGLQFAMDADSLLLNYDKWQVSKDNFFRYDPSGLVINDFKINSNNQSLQIGSKSLSPAAPVDIVFTDFSIASLTKFAKQDSLLADGILNGKVEVKNILKTPVFTSDLQIKNLSYKRDTIGDLVLKVNNEEANTFAANISIEGNRNDIRVDGKYYTGEGKMDLNLNLGQVNLAAIKPFAGESLQDIRGYLKGKLAITGTMTKPVLNGNLHFDSAFVIPSITGEPLRLSNDNIEFDQDGFNFSKFSFLDSANNKATVDGNVYTSDFRNYKFDLTFNAANFRVVNSQQAPNKLFYGKLNMDAAANVTGDISSPKLDGDIRVNKATDFTLVLPSNDPEVVTRLGVVRFVDKNHPADTLVTQMKLDSFSRNAQVKGMDIGMNIETDSNALFTVIIDERSGDALSIRGRSDLSFGMDKSGKMSLTGNYEVESGTYNLSLDVLKRKFNIQRGSTITWTGDPTSALLNLTATYVANTASIDLVEPELAGRPQSEINKFKQKLPFMVSLKMEGELLKPTITFDISLPDNVLTFWPDVDTKLQQVKSDASELNKQVFALLLLGRFVGENPLQSGSDGLSAGQMAFQSASQILTNQLNQLAGNLIKGVDINFDLNNQQDYSSGSEQDRTDLNVSVSKRLFNDRIKVNIGSNFELQGPQQPNQNAANIAGDLAIDYQLSKDGRYMVRAYRKNQYELVVEGQVIETGVSFILTLDYNHFKEIFGGTRAQRIEARRLSRDSKKVTSR